MTYHSHKSSHGWHRCRSYECYFDAEDDFQKKTSRVEMKEGMIGAPHHFEWFHCSLSKHNALKDFHRSPSFLVHLHHQVASIGYLEYEETFVLAGNEDKICLLVHGHLV